MQQGDALIFQTEDDGDIRSENGILEMTAGFESMAYLSMFGGQEGWWGDEDETDPDFRTLSETESLLNTTAPIPANLRRIEQAALRDLAAFTNKRIANRVAVVATMPKVDTVRLQVTIEADGVEFEFMFTQNWRAQG